MGQSLIPFRKLHGLGNDFVLVDGVDGGELPIDRLIARAGQICDRHRGVGADGLLLLLPPRSEGALATMRIINADGSEPETCGNGIRCAARELSRQRPELPGMTIDTLAGPVVCQVVSSDDVSSEIKVDMGRASLDPATLPMAVQGDRFVDQPLALAAGERVRGTAVSMGNPHFVVFAADGELRELASSRGPELERHPAFPNRTNVGFARVADQGVDLWVWERGVGVTQACGSGACAAAVAAVVTQRLPADSALPVRLPGGVLCVEVAADLSRVWMQGPAVEVFSGALDAFRAL